MMRPAFSGAKNSGAGSVPAMTLTKPSIASWLPCIAPMSCCISGGGRLDLREVAGELVDRQRLLVPGALVVGHRVVVGASLGERVVEGRRHRLGVTERVGDPERRDRVLVVAGVADERPPRAVGLEEEARQVARAHEARLPLGALASAPRTPARASNDFM